ncbi:hypothetical protein DFJ74DRAFT_713441 [Hyaloraphidium curvatum]|nr:hypothetical protein DFJ74DRAFT_713441 [Hyaloraphidium curvatum]
MAAAAFDFLAAPVFFADGPPFGAPSGDARGRSAAQRAAEAAAAPLFAAARGAPPPRPPAPTRWGSASPQVPPPTPPPLAGRYPSPPPSALPAGPAAAPAAALLPAPAAPERPRESPDEAAASRVAVLRQVSREASVSSLASSGSDKSARSVRFFEVVQVRYTYPPASYDRSSMPMSDLTRDDVIELIRYRQEMKRATPDADGTVSYGRPRPLHLQQPECAAGYPSPPISPSFVPAPEHALSPAAECGFGPYFDPCSDMAGSPTYVDARDDLDGASFAEHRASALAMC